MKVTVYNIYTDKTETFTGEPEQVRNQLTSRYTFLSRYRNQSLQEDLNKLSSQQSLMVTVTD